MTGDRLEPPVCNPVQDEGVLGCPHSLGCCRDIPSMPFLPGLEQGLTRILVQLPQSCAPPGLDHVPRGHLGATGCGEEKPGKDSKSCWGFRLSPACSSPSIHPVLGCSQGLVPPRPSPFPIYSLSALTCPSLSSCRTLNNNNITSIPVSSFNHMPKLRTL